MPPKYMAKKRARTGCITCKKRRIKCDEGKPSCNRCVSSGRNCGGYNLSVKFVNMPLIAGMEGLRPLSTSIKGSDSEKQHFVSCRRATEGGLSMHSCSISAFWTTLAPQLGHTDEAVKHALIALGATYCLGKLKRGHSPSHIAQLEAFIDQQYCRSMGRVHAHLEKKDPRSTGLALACCLVFISLEFLRSNQSAAIVHLRNGINIIVSVLDLRRLSRASAESDSTPTADNLDLSDADLWDIVDQFRTVEFTLNVFSSNVSMTLGMHLRRVNGSQHRQPVRDITRVEDGYAERVAYFHDAMARYSELQAYQGDEMFWSQSQMRKELFIMRKRGLAIMQAIECFWASDSAPPAGTWSSYSSRMDWLLVSAARTFVTLTPFGVHACAKVATLDYVQDEVTKGVYLAAKMQLEHAANGMPPSDFSLEIGTTALMYWAWVMSSRPETKVVSFDVLQGVDRKEGPWDASQIIESIARVSELRLLIC